MWKVFWFMYYDCDIPEQYFSHWITNFLYMTDTLFLFSAIFNAEFILSGVMRQTVDFKSYQIDVH